MKIGELAQLCGVPQATIRYYVRSGMLVPNDSGAQYDFSQREYRNLQLILKMKQQHFSLKEIQDYLVLTRHSNFIEPDTIESCRNMLMNKREEICSQIQQLQQSVQDIDQEILALNSRVIPRQHKTGLPLSALDLLACPHCGSPLLVGGASIQGNFLSSGTLHCSKEENCPGFQAVIEDGIVKTGNLYTAPYDKPDLTRGLYRDMIPAFSSAMQKCYDFIHDSLQTRDLHGKVILESNINGYFFLYQHLQLLPEGCVYVVTDKYPEMLEMYKSLIEQMDVKRDILYIADASEHLPLRQSCVDLHITCFGENEYQLYHQHSFLDDAKGFLKSEAEIFGALFSYDKGARSRQNLRKKYPESSQRCFQSDYLRQDYAAAGFSMALTEAGEALDSGTKQYSFDCHVKGEPLRIVRFTARRNCLKRSIRAV